MLLEKTGGSQSRVNLREQKLSHNICIKKMLFFGGGGGGGGGQDNGIGTFGQSFFWMLPQEADFSGGCCVVFLSFGFPVGFGQ